MKRFAVALALGLSLVGSADKFPGKVKISVDIGVRHDVEPLDILIVVDDSASMGPHQAKFSKLGSEITKLQAAGVPLQIAITTTSREDAPHYTVLNSATPDLDKEITKAVVSVGIDGDPTETVFYPVEYILRDWRAKLKLSEGKLAIIAITDADEQGALSEADFVDFLKGRKKNGLDDLLVHSFLATQRNGSCTSDQTEPPVKLQAFTKSLKGTKYELCDVDQAANIETMGKKLLAALGTGRGTGARISEIPLTTEPDVDSIRVTYGSQLLKAGDFRKGWVYDSTARSILLGNNIQWSVQPAGTQLEVTFIPADWQD